MVIVYGIPNCDIVKKATGWLKKNEVPYRFHNFKSEGISKTKLLDWINIAGLDRVINKRSTTWRALPGDVQIAMAETMKAVEMLMIETSIIKRPIVETAAGLLIGFDEKEYQKTFAL